MHSPVDYGTHLPVVMRAMQLTTGPVLEMGMGYNSSYTMHWMCAARRRPITSFESKPKWFVFARWFETDWHKIVLTRDWDAADIEYDWDVALLDFDSNPLRVNAAKRLAHRVKYIVLHDTNGRYFNLTHFDTLLPLFKWRWTYNQYTPHTTVFSNLVDLTGFCV